MQKFTLHLLFAIFPLLLTACSSIETAKTMPDKTEQWATEIDKEANLYRIDNKLFRSEQLIPENYSLLKQQGIKTLINLRFFDRDDDKQAFKNTDLILINAPLLTWHITPKEVASVLWQIEQNQKQGAVLVHCYHGADRTSLISAMYRVIYQNWTLEEAKREMIEGPYGFHSVWKNIEQFFTEDNVFEIKQELVKLRKGDTT